MLHLCLDPAQWTAGLFTVTKQQCEEVRCGDGGVGVAAEEGQEVLPRVHDRPPPEARGLPSLQPAALCPQADTQETVLGRQEQAEQRLQASGNPEMRC